MYFSLARYILIVVLREVPPVAAPCWCDCSVRFLALEQPDLMPAWQCRQLSHGIPCCCRKLWTPHNCQHAGWLAGFAFLWKLFTWGDWLYVDEPFPCRATLCLVIRYREGLLVVRLLAQVRKWKSASPVNTTSSPTLCLQRFYTSTLKLAASLVHTVIKPGCCVQGW